jgi:hypothetical protein
MVPCGTRVAWPGPVEECAARLHEAQGAWPTPLRAGSAVTKREGVRTVKKLLLLALAGLGAFAVWRKVQADRAELDLWTEATTSDD